MAKIIYTKHALHQMRIRKVEEKDIVKTIENPQIIYPSEKRRGVRKLVRKINSKSLFVVVIYKAKLTVVITVGWR